MNFGLYLVHQGAITAEQFVEALENQLVTKPQIGSLAVEMNKLSIKQVFSILRLQADMPNKMFGELAVENDLITTDELATLLYHQLVRVKPIAEIILELGFLSGDEIDQQQREFRNATIKTNDYEVMVHN